MARLFWLNDETWAAIEPHLPTNQPGAHTTVYNRFNRWSRRQVRRDILEALVATGMLSYSTAVDSTYVKAHRSAHGGKGGRRPRRSAPRAAARPRRSTS